jgi:putative acetyltransferase
MSESLLHSDIMLRVANTKKEFDDGRALFHQYANSLDLDLSFQNFAKELETIEEQYSAPTGALLLAYKRELPVACAGVRKIDTSIAELKRMYVHPDYRQYKIGKKLLELALDRARELDYHYIRLDTLPTMTPALNLYRAFGFYEIPAYRFNPVSGAVYMEKKLIK